MDEERAGDGTAEEKEEEAVAHAPADPVLTHPGEEGIEALSSTEETLSDHESDNGDAVLSCRPRADQLDRRPQRLTALKQREAPRKLIQDRKI